MKFEDLIKQQESELETLLSGGTSPTLAEVTGYEFRGFNFNPATLLTATRKFKKGFYGSPEIGWLWGYNVPVVQNDVSLPWIEKTDHDGPIKYYPFKVFPPDKSAGSKHANGMIVDYKASGQYSPIDPVQQTIDYLVFPDPSNPNLILGVSYFRTFAGNPRLGYFALDRYNRNDVTAAARFFESHELETLKKFAEAFFPSYESVLTPNEVASNIDLQMARVSSNRSQSLKLILFALEHVLPGLVGEKSSFSQMSIQDRRKFLDRVFRSDAKGPIGGLLRDLARLKVLIVSGYYSDARAQKAVGFVPVEERAKYTPTQLNPKVQQNITSVVPDLDTVDTDICVIGSGAAGAVIAANAARDGKRVVLIEEGPHVPYSAINHREGEMVAKLYKEGGLQTSVDFDMTILQGKCLGGTTVINNLICFRLLNDPDLGSAHGDALLDSWKSDPSIGIDIDRGKLNASYDRIEQRLGVIRTEKTLALENAATLLDGLAKVSQSDPTLRQAHSGLFRKNFDHCLGCGQCNFGCPYGRKQSMLETFIPDAVAAGAQIFVNCHAKKIHHDTKRATHVECEFSSGRTVNIRAKKIVVSCGAIGSTKLLMKSQIGNKNLGKRFSFNAATPMLAEFDRPINGWDGVQMGAFIDAGKFMLESIFYPPMSYAMTMPGWFEQHFERMKKYNNFACAGVLIGTDHESSVKGWSLVPDLTGPVDLKLTETDLTNLRAGMIALTKLFFSAGATAVLPAAFVDRIITRQDYDTGRIEAIVHEIVQKPDDILLSSSHPQGGNAMSADPKVGVIDQFFKVHGYENIFVCDASVFPTTIRVNPQLTIMAIADYAWRESIIR